jgi:hypothetical protein
MLWAYVLILVLVLGVCFIAKLVLHATVQELGGPYLAFATPQLILLTLMMWLRTWEAKRAPAPKRVALLASLFGAFFFGAIAAALLYSAITLHLLKPNDPILIFFCFAALVGVVTSSITMYHTTLSSAASRAPQVRERSS